MIVYAPDAARDVERFHARFSEYSGAVAERFMARLALAEGRIEARPQTYRLLRDGETHRYSFKINRIAYMLDYQIEPLQIVVVRVWHGRQIRPE